jgi:hypothetical protein
VHDGSLNIYKILDTLLLQNGIFYDCFPTTLEKVKRFTQNEKKFVRSLSIKHVSLFISHEKIGSGKAIKVI